MEGCVLGNQGVGALGSSASCFNLHWKKPFWKFNPVDELDECVLHDVTFIFSYTFWASVETDTRTVHLGFCFTL